MESDSPGIRSHITLFLCILLHAFTHAYGSMLVPLYLLMVADLHLGKVQWASLLVSIYSIVYCLGSYAAGVAADRYNRKLLLGIGLLGNAVAMVLMGLTHSYGWLVVWAVMAGVAGTIFHPAAGALVPSHYPKSPGMAVGLLGIGSGVGFFAGPQYAGWRAQSARWSWSGFTIAQWQRPCIELGVAGFLIGLVFLLVARESRASNEKEPVQASVPLGRAMSLRVLLIGLILGCRDFAGVGGLSLAGIYLLRAHHFDPKNTGTVLGTMMLFSVLVNPTLVWLTPGRRRLIALVISLLLGGAVATTVPLFSAALALPVLCAFQTCQLGSYALSDTALLERVPGALRGRVYGLFFIIAGSMGSLGPWVMGKWTDLLEDRANSASGYVLPFAVLGLAMMMAGLAMPLIAGLGLPLAGVVEPITETMPAGVGPVG